MKHCLNHHHKGSVLVTALLICTVVAGLCATGLYIATQTSTAGLQTASWQQALDAAESAVDQAIRALNNDATGASGAWTGWSTQAVPLPTPPTTLAFAAPPFASPAPLAATAAPTSGSYNYLNPAVSLTFSQTEGNANVTSWVTIDTAGNNLINSSGQQWYRIRATGQAGVPGLVRASYNRLDNDLRNSLYLRVNRKTGAAISSSQVTRSVEVIVYPNAGGGWARAITMKAGVQMSGGGTVDSFNSNGVSKTWSLAGRDNPGQAQVGISNNTTNSDLRNTYVYGSLAYSGTPVKNTTNVTQGTMTPGPVTPASTVDPTSAYWAQTDNLQQYTTAQQGSFPIFVGGASANYTGYTGGGGLPKDASNNTVTNFTTAPNSSAANPALFKINGDFTVSGSNTFAIHSGNTGGGSGSITYAVIWVTGKFVTSGSAIVTQDSDVKVTWIVDNDITVSGDTYNNAAGVASNVEFVGVGTNHNVTDSGSATFVGTINAPGDNVTISGTGDFTGAAIGNTLTISGGGSFHYDDALSSSPGSSTVGVYSFASWFEDNSDPTRGIIY